MKSPLVKLRKLALHKSDAKKDTRDHHYATLLDELDKASEDMLDMRSCYDNLLSAAAATANSAYEFSESLLEMGNFLLELTASNAGGECGNVFLMLGKVQLELQKLVDSYRSHIIHTITNPSDSLLSELRKVEEMKLQCDEKREVYEHMAAQYRDKERLRSRKGDNITSQQVKEALYQYDDVAKLCVFRVKSLKQGQFRSLLTQAARHHTAQLNFFRKGLKSLETVDPQIKIVSDNQHIDYQLVGLVDGEFEEAERMNCYENIEYGELSFDYSQNKQGLDNDCTSRISMELDRADLQYPHALKLEETELSLSINQGEQTFSQRTRPSSYSAPIYPDKFDPVERTREIQPPSVRKFHTYALPTPAAAKISASTNTGSGPQSSSTSLSTSTKNPRHSSPIDTRKHENSSITSIRLPPPLSIGHSLPQFDNASDASKNKRQAFSGPIPSKQRSMKPIIHTSVPITSLELPQLVSGSQAPVSQLSSSPNAYRSASPPLVSSPKISELHELPRPPGSLASKPASTSMTGHSAPLVIKNHELHPTNRSPRLASNTASPLPLPPLAVTRSFSIPSGNHRAMALRVTELLESSQIPENVEDVTSPPLMPMSSKKKSLRTVSEVASNSG